MEEIRAPVYVVGDIHGNIFDLIRVLVYTCTPPISQILFLGDYVDRGEFSLEVITLLFALYCAYPEKIVLLRGNHEFSNVNSTYGFQDEIHKEYKSLTLWNEVNKVFEWLPLAAVVSNAVFCVHGGLSPQFNNLKQLEVISRPMSDYDHSDLVSDLVWSDPSGATQSYTRSQRGSGVTFGVVAVQSFLRSTNLKYIIRGHQCVPLGISRFGQNTVYTVFSCSNYEDCEGNRCGILFISADIKLQAFSLPAITQIPRKDVVFTGEETDEPRHTSLALNLKLADMRVHSRPKSNVNIFAKHNPIYSHSNSLSQSSFNQHRKGLPPLPAETV